MPGWKYPEKSEASEENEVKDMFSLWNWQKETELSCGVPVKNPEIVKYV